MTGTLVAGLCALPVLAPAAPELPRAVDFVLGHQVAALIGSGIANEDASKGGEPKRVEMTTQDGKVAASVVLEAKDGKMVGTVETKVDLPLFILPANSKVTLVGSICPAADGKVEFTLKLGSNGRDGGRGSVAYDHNVETRVVAMVGDDASVISADVGMKQATRSTLGGRQAYIEVSASARLPGGRFDGRINDLKDLRHSSGATPAEAQLAVDNLLRAAILAYGALEGARENWQGGGCIKIKAASPGRVLPAATSRIPVAVNHRKDGSSVPAKVAVELSGGKSVAPAVIAKAPGDLTHVAPNDRKARMKITLTATSRRGKDKLELDLSTGGQAYSAAGGAGDFHGTGTICDLAAPFTIEGGGNVVKFVPTSAKGGSYSYAGNMSGFGVFGNGTYTVKHEGDVPVGITATGPGSVKTPMGTHTKVDTEKYTLRPSSAACGS